MIWQLSDRQTNSQKTEPVSTGDTGSHHGSLEFEFAADIDPARAGFIPEWQFRELQIGRLVRLGQIYPFDKYPEILVDIVRYLTIELAVGPLVYAKRARHTAIAKTEISDKLL